MIKSNNYIRPKVIITLPDRKGIYVEGNGGKGKEVGDVIESNMRCAKKEVEGM